MVPPLVNGLSVDVEDWFQVGAFEHVIARGEWDGLTRRVEANCDAVLGEQQWHARLSAALHSGSMVLAEQGLHDAEGKLLHTLQGVAGVRFALEETLGLDAQSQTLFLSGNTQRVYQL